MSSCTGAPLPACSSQGCRPSGRAERRTPADLLRLLQNAFLHAEHDRFDEAAARAAVRDAATEFRRILETDDYALLARIDSSPETPPHSDRARGLLYNLAFLEYNDFYCRSHSVIRRIDAYRAASRGAQECRHRVSPSQSGISVRNTPGAFLRLQRMLEGRRSFALCFLTYSDSPTATRSLIFWKRNFARACE